jgi:hypothetical protein
VDIKTKTPLTKDVSFGWQLSEPADSTRVDQKAAMNRSVPAVEEGFFSAIPRVLVIGLGLTIVLCLALVGYHLMRPKKRTF